MVGGLQAARSLVHLAQVFELANNARLLPDPELAAHRLGAPAGDRCRRDALPVGDGGDRRRDARAAVAQPADDGNWSLREAIDGCVAAGLASIGVWREQLAEVGWTRPCRLVGRRRSAGVLAVPRRLLHRLRSGRAQAAHDDNRAALDEAAASGRATLCLVPGGLPAGDRDLAAARAGRPRPSSGWCRTRASCGVTLGIEPMNPIYAADRGVVSTLGPGAGHRRAVRRRRGRRRGGHLPRVVGPGRRRRRSPAPESASTATRCATGSPRCRPTRCWPAA